MGTNFRVVTAAALLSWACLSAVGSARAEERDANSYAAYAITQVAKAKDFEKVPRAKTLEGYFQSMGPGQLSTISEDNIDRIAKLLNDDDDYVKAVAARLLGKFGRRAERSLAALQCARVLPGGTEDSATSSRYMQEAIDNINAQIVAEGGTPSAPQGPRADGVAWNSLSFCSPTGYCVNVAESDQHRIGKLEIRFNGQEVPLSAAQFGAIENPSIREIQLVSVGATHRLDIPYMSKGASTRMVYSLTLDKGRVVAN